MIYPEVAMSVEVRVNGLGTGSVGMGRQVPEGGYGQAF